jgi:hypothetical protein
MNDSVLARVLEIARRSSPAGVVVFDLDSTLLDNRPRQARIFREFGRSHGVPELGAADPGHWLGWDLRVPLRNLGLREPRVAEVFPALKDFWRERFFTSEYCREDVPIAGAASFVGAVAQAPARVVYLTGRHEGMRQGTVAVLSRHGFPVPDAARGEALLLMKPSLGDSDDAFKAGAHEQVRRLGRVLAAFDNEPRHANDLLQSFPDAVVVHLATDHSGREFPLAQGIPSISDFRMDSDA